MICADKPAVITVPGLGGSGVGHWQTIWERSRSDTARAELGAWDDPEREFWVAALDAAIRRADRPVTLVAHSLGCLAVAWWTMRRPVLQQGTVAGALLVAPPDIERLEAPLVLRRFAPVPPDPLPFPSILVASENDPWVAIDRARELAAAWGSDFVAAGALGHVNAESGIGAWPEGEALLDRLLTASTSRL